MQNLVFDMRLLVACIHFVETYSSYSSLDNVMQFNIYDMQNILDDMPKLWRHILKHACVLISEK